ncbi:sensor histidine kinase [Flavobacterium limnophilum]|uniref:sensor histidine kinase n=1 Tax=Flavobacterium limnophilum TaxID=3003262 RepID=UPI002482637C|nr:PAS domain S-box protein [Flavobacterium limnophilum]
MRNGKIRTRLINWFAIRPITTGGLLFLVLGIATISQSILRNHVLKEDERNEMNAILTDAHLKIEQSLKNCYTTTVSLALTLDSNGIPQNFDTISKQLLKSNPLISVVQMVPNGVIKYIYPLKGNEAAMNLNILGVKDLKKEAENSIKTQKIYFAGPLKLRQGGIGIVGRLPIYNKNKFWGFTAVIIKLETLLKASGIKSMDKSNYYFQFSKRNPITLKEQFFLPSKTDLSKSYYVSQAITDSDSKLYLVAKKTYAIYPEILFSSILGLIVAISFGVLTTKLLKKPEELRFLLKKQEAKLLKNEMKFKTIIDQAPIGFAIIDTRSGNLMEANKKYCDLFGYTFEEIKKLDIKRLTHPDDLEKSLEYVKNLDEGKITEYSMEKRCVMKTGKIIWINLTVSQLCESNEKPTSHISFVKDITERKEAEALIEKSQARYKSLIDTIDGIVWEYDLEIKSSTFISKKIENLLGYSIEEYSESPTFWEDHIHPEDREFALALSAKENKNYINHDYEYRMLTKNGEVIWVRDIINYVFENGKPVISRGIMIDITIMKEAEKNLSNSLQLVTEQNKRLLNFSYIVSHNLRSHTSNIESIISLIESAESEEERSEMMRLLKSVSNSLDETMKHLNEVVNINTNINLVIKPLNLNKYIGKAKEVLSEQILSNEVTIITNVPYDAMINYNSAYLESILYNLISNAIRYRHPQRKPIITLNLHKQNDKYVIEVSDNGIGIDLVRNADKIFGMYKTFSNNSDSRGIGLFITKNQVDAMGGTITVDSTPNVGSTFKIYTK